MIQLGKMDNEDDLEALLQTQSQYENGTNQKDDEQVAAQV